MTVMHAPRLVAETTLARSRGKVVPNPALPNLYIVKRVGSWPIGAIVPKAALPYGFQGHLDLGVVVETERPATHGTALTTLGATPKTPDESVAANALLRGKVADLEGQLAAMQAALVERDARIQALAADLAAAEDMLKTSAAVGDIVAGSVEQARLDAGPTPAVNTKGLPVVTAPWKD